VPCGANDARHDITPIMKSWKKDPPLFLTGFLFMVLFFFFTAVFNHWREIKAAIVKLFSG
jgi:hypothetical protein